MSSTSNRPSILRQLRVAAAFLEVVQERGADLASIAENARDAERRDGRVENRRDACRYQAAGDSDHGLEGDRFCRCEPLLSPAAKRRVLSRTVVICLSFISTSTLRTPSIGFAQLNVCGARKDFGI